jgi:Spy/CpxP family protein refolding chaperone
MMRFKILTPVCFLFFLGFLSPAFSQNPGMRHGHEMGMRPWKGEPRSWRASELNLSPDQTKNLDLIQQNYFKETHLLRSRLYVKWLELREILTNPSVKMESIRSKQGEMVALQQELEEKTFGYLIQVRELLNPEQLKRWSPEQELSLSWKRMHEPGPMRPMHSPPPQETPRKE